MVGNHLQGNINVEENVGIIMIMMIGILQPAEQITIFIPMNLVFGLERRKFEGGSEMKINLTKLLEVIEPKPTNTTDASYLIYKNRTAENSPYAFYLEDAESLKEEK